MGFKTFYLLRNGAVCTKPITILGFHHHHHQNHNWQPYDLSRHVIQSDYEGFGTAVFYPRTQQSTTYYRKKLIYFAVTRNPQHLHRHQTLYLRQLVRFLNTSNTNKLNTDYL